MNAENLRRVAHELRAFPPAYDQRTWIETEPGCGTRACIGGTAELLIHEDRGLVYDEEQYRLIGQEEIEAWLGITTDQGRTLFGAFPEIRSTGRAWPEPFDLRYREAVTGRSAESPAFVAADLLESLANGTVSL